MKYLTLLSLLFLNWPLKAETFIDRVYEIEDDFVKFESGRVAFLKSSVSQLQKNDLIKVRVDKKYNLVSYKKIDPPSPAFKRLTSFFPNSLMNSGEENFIQETFEPTIVASKEEAMNIFNRSNPYYKRVSECSDRAHVWAHDEFKLTGTKSLKAFIFFTASYINSVRLKWWFHVAPMYRVNVGGEIKDLVMDFRYTDRPMEVKDWSDQFVYTKRPCKLTTKFSEYDVNPQTENCYLIFESMHYKIPSQLQQKELSGTEKLKTTDYELKLAFKYGFEKRVEN